MNSKLLKLKWKKKNKMKNKFLLFVFLFIITSCNENNPNFLTYEKIIDGDTFIASGKKIRLWGIDAPEKGEPESFTASLYLEVLLKQGELICNEMSIDKYKRHVMRCYSGEEDIAASLVKNGMARDYKTYSKGYYEIDEQKAKNNKLGIWSGNRI